MTRGKRQPQQTRSSGWSQCVRQTGGGRPPIGLQRGHRQSNQEARGAQLNRSSDHRANRSSGHLHDRKSNWNQRNRSKRRNRNGCTGLSLWWLGISNRRGASTWAWSRRWRRSALSRSRATAGGGAHQGTPQGPGDGGPSSPDRLPAQRERELKTQMADREDKLKEAEALMTTAFDEKVRAQKEHEKAFTMARKFHAFVGYPGNMVTKARLYDESMKKLEVVPTPKVLRILIDYSGKVEKFLGELHTLLQYGEQREEAGPSERGPEPELVPSKLLP